MSAVSLEAVDRIIAAMCEGSNVKDLMSLKPDRAALAREIEDLRETYEMRLAYDALPTRPMKNSNIARLNRAAKRFRDHLSKFLNNDPALIDLLRRAVPKQEPPARLVSLQTLDRLKRDTDALIRSTDLLLKVNETPEPERGGVEQSQTRHLQFTGWQELNGPDTMHWLVAYAIPRLLRDSFGMEAKSSRGDSNIASGPSVRFAQAVLEELRVVSPKTGKPLNPYGIEDHWRRRYEALKDTPHQG
jgi:hypothetical protein